LNSTLEYLSAHFVVLFLISFLNNTLKSLIKSSQYSLYKVVQILSNQLNSFIQSIFVCNSDNNSLSLGSHNSLISDFKFSNCLTSLIESIVSFTILVLSAISDEFIIPIFVFSSPFLLSCINAFSAVCGVIIAGFFHSGSASSHLFTFG